MAGRKTARSAAQALKDRKKLSNHNTKVVVDEHGHAHMLLFGNRIAVYTADNRLFITTAGWDTVTTRGRLSEIGGFRLSRSRGTLRLNNNDWTGKWTEIVEAGPVTMFNYNEPPEYL